MDNALMVGLQAQRVLQQRMDAVANNLANAATTGFKADTFSFEQESEDPAAALDRPHDIRFVRESGIVRDMGQGPIQTTAAPFDVAIQGPGFFAVRGDNGTLYTRDGAFTLSADGTLTTREGRPVLSDSGAPLVFDTRGETPTIDSEGAVKIAGVEAGRIGVFSFAAPASLQKVGDNLYDPAGQAATAADSRIVQGALEGSNVRPVVELTRLMEIARAYESAARMISNDDDLRRTAVDRLGRAAA